MPTYRINKGDKVYIQNIDGERMYGVVTGAFKGMARVRFNNGATALMAQSRLRKEGE
jgi:hypothetical protein